VSLPLNRRPSAGASPAGGDPWTPWRRSEHGSSARAILLTVLGEFVLPSGGHVWTSTLIEALGALGVESKTTRQAVARTAAADLLVPERIGRQTRWSLTPAASRLLTEGAERIYLFGRTTPEWDGRWLLIWTTVPESNRHLRYRLRSRLAWRGFAAVAPGAWLSPWATQEPAAVAILTELGLAGEALSFVGRPGELGALPADVYRAWDLAAIETDYRAFIEVTTSTEPTDDRAAFVALATLVHDWRHFPAADPALPAPLLPGSWSGAAAAELFHRRRAAWGAAAWRWWNSSSPP
jgi:phenylacetic acid degradation operon negative regulatory protein